MRGRFITLEGGEGVGKSTQLSTVHDYLKAQGIPCVVTREPGGTTLGERLRELLLATSESAMAPLCELLLMFAARAEHIARVIEPALAAGTWVVSDRFIDASYAYQGGGRELSKATIDALAQLVVGHCRPNLTLLLDAPPEIGRARAAARRGTVDRFEAEQAAFFERVRAAYLARATQEPERVKVIDASLSQREVSARVERELEKYCMGKP